jgi:DNA-binding response OmpR family regulator
VGRDPGRLPTGTVAADTVGELFAAGADDYVAKPFAGPELAARVGTGADDARGLLGAVLERLRRTRARTAAATACP